MRQGEKRLAEMRNNAKAGWRISDVEVVCGAFGATLRPPSSGSHFKVSHPNHAAILTIPARRDIKPVYIKLFVAFIDEIRTREHDDPP